MLKDEKNKKRKIIIILSVFLSLFIFLCIIFVDNKNIIYEDFLINEANIDDFDIKIVHLSDLHFPKIKVNLEKMLAKIEEEKPDIIAITGDLIDRSAVIQKSGVFEFIEQLTLIAPVYYVNGNHEAAHFEAYMLYDNLNNNGVTILDNQSMNITINGKDVTIVGLSDNEDYTSKVFDNSIENNYVVLLAHRPDYNKWLTYISNSNEVIPNIVLTGHVHGGQIRLFGKGILGPRMSMFPKFDSGMYTALNDKETKMIVSRGVGSSIIPYRFNNNPHIPVIKIKI